MDKDLIREKLILLDNFLKDYKESDSENVVSVIKEIIEEMNKDNINLFELLQNSGWYLNEEDYKNDLRLDLTMNPKAMIESILYVVKNEVLNINDIS